MPLGLWLVIRAVEPNRAFSRLYLAAMLCWSISRPKGIVAAGVWTIWAALVVDPKRPPLPRRHRSAWHPAMAFTHPALMSLIYLRSAASVATRPAFPAALADGLRGHGCAGAGGPTSPPRRLWPDQSDDRRAARGRPVQLRRSALDAGTLGFFPVLAMFGCCCWRPGSRAWRRAGAYPAPPSSSSPSSACGSPPTAQAS